jgi:magnesium-transporting ATPase (P-type)
LIGKAQKRRGFMNLSSGEIALLNKDSLAGDRNSSSKLVVDEVYLDGKLIKAEYVDEEEKSFGIFMHSLILSNYAEVIKINNKEINVIGDEYEKAIFHYAASKGFDKKLIESIAPKVNELTFEYDNNLKVSTHLINEKLRIVSKGTPEELLKRCSHILMDSKFVKFSRKIYKEVNTVLIEMLERCVSVYAIALKDISSISKVLSKDKYINHMTLVGLVGMVRA